MEFWGVIAAWGSAVAAIITIVVSLYISWSNSSPIIVAYLYNDRDNGSMIFCVENCGKKPAYNIHISGFDFTKLVQEQFKETLKDSFITKGIPLLTPGRSRETIISTTEYAVRHFSNVEQKIRVSYKKPVAGWKIKSEENFILDYYSFKATIYIHNEEHKIRVALDKIAKYVEVIKKQINKTANDSNKVFQETLSAEEIRVLKKALAQSPALLGIRKSILNG